MRLTSNVSPVGPGHGIATPMVAAPWTPAQIFGTSLAFAVRADKVGLTERTARSGSNILSLVNDGGTAPAATSSATHYPTVDESVPLGAYGAIRTSGPQTVLATPSGCPTGTQAWTQYLLVRQISQPAGNDTTIITLGPTDGSSQAIGVGSTTPSNGAHLITRGQGSNPAILAAQGTWDTAARLIEVRNDGAGLGLTMRVNGGKLGATVAGAVTIAAGGRWGVCGFYPTLDVYGAPDTRIYAAGVILGVPSSAQYGAFLRYLHSEFSFTPARFVDVLGDSRTAGTISGANTTSYVALMKSQYLAATGEIVDVKNDGVSSETTAQLLARVTADYLDHLPHTALGGRTVVILRGRTNDPGAFLTSQQSYDNLKAASALIRAIGHKTIISTEHSCVAYTSGDRANVASFNALALNGVVAGDFDGVADIRGVIPNYATINPTTLELPDGVHQSDALLAAEAIIYRAAVDALP